MKFRIYLRVIGPEAAVRSFSTDASIPQSTVMALRREAVWPPSTQGGQLSWQWQTQFVEAQPDTVEAVIAQLIGSNKSVAAPIKKHRTRLTLASLVIVAECAKAEVPGGLYFSTETISAIHELGVDVDLDFTQAN